MTPLQALFMWLGVIATVWVAISCVASYLRTDDPPSRLPPPNIRSRRRDWDRHEFWRQS